MLNITCVKHQLISNQPSRITTRVYLQAPLKNVLDLKCEFHGKSREIVMSFIVRSVHATCARPDSSTHF